MIGDGPPNDQGGPDKEIELEVLPDRHETFVSLDNILGQLEEYADRPEQRQLDTVLGYLRETGPESSESVRQENHKLLNDAVAFAMMRRISRESGYTARIIDLSARAINTILSKVPALRAARVPHLDRLDRPTLKVLARAQLLLTREHGFRWIWHSDSDPTALDLGQAGDLYSLSRGDLLGKLYRVVAPKLTWMGSAIPIDRPVLKYVPKTTYEASAALVMQNYDACFLWCDALLETGNQASDVEALRVKAIAAVNIGRSEEALAILSEAETVSASPALKAHLCYLQGLIESKRRYRLSESKVHYSRGLSHLDRAPDSGEDLDLERAWLLNGLALGEAVRGRKDSESSSQHFQRAFDLLQEAFRMIRSGDGGDRVYLRFNLLSNSSFLMEMQGQYDLAIDVLRKTFEFLEARPESEDREWRPTLDYRLGVLYYRWGRMRRANALLSEALEADGKGADWLTREHILRALGAVSFERGEFERASRFFERGRDLCREARAADGFREHTRGLIASLSRAGEGGRARELVESGAAEEGSDPWDDASLLASRIERCPVSPRPKPPAYMAEVDLEDVPSLDLTRFLSSGVAQTESSPSASAFEP